MFSERGLNNKINHFHEKALQITCKDGLSDFETMLEEDYAVTIHVKNLQVLINEIFKTQHSFDPTFMPDWKVCSAR